MQGENTAAQGVNSKIELTQGLFLQEATNSSLGDQPEPPQDTLVLPLC